MENINNEISKRRRVRKTLLLKINDEIKEISNSKPTLLINSQTIEEIEKKYNRNNILLTEKGIVYSNYIKTETKIFPPSIHPMLRVKSMEKIEKSKKNLELIGSSYDDDALSPIINFFPKKIDLASKKLTNVDKRYTKNNGSIQKFIEHNLDNSLSKGEDQLNKSTKIENSKLHKLIIKILSIKDNENMEKIIKKNIKKLRKYCYKFRKKKKKINRIYKSKEHKINIIITPSNNSDKKINEKEKLHKPSNFKMMHPSSSKKQKNFLSLKNKRNPIKLKTLNEDDGTNLIIQLHKIKMDKPKKSFDNNKNIIINNENNENNNEEEVPFIHNINKSLMKSSINKKPKNYDLRCVTNVEKKGRNNIKKFNKKKLLIRNTSLFYGKDNDKMSLFIKKDKKDKVELHDNLLFKSNKSNKKIKKIEINKSENKKSSVLNQVNLKKLNIYLRKKSKKKLIDSPMRKVDDYSICNTNYFTNIFTITQFTNDKVNNRKKSYNKI